MRPTGTALAPASVVELERQPRRVASPVGSPCAGSRLDRSATFERGPSTWSISRAIDRAERIASPGMSPTATATIVGTQGGKSFIAPCPRRSRPDDASHALLNELLAGTPSPSPPSTPERSLKSKRSIAGAGLLTTSYRSPIMPSGERRMTLGRRSGLFPRASHPRNNRSHIQRFERSATRMRRKPALPALTPEREGSTPCGHSPRRVNRGFCEPDFLKKGALCGYSRRLRAQFVATRYRLAGWTARLRGPYLEDQIYDRND
jgi:hypothetical protein